MLPESSRAVKGRPSSSTCRVGVLGGSVLWRVHPANQDLLTVCGGARSSLVCMGSSRGNAVCIFSLSPDWFLSGWHGGKAWGRAKLPVRCLSLLNSRMSSAQSRASSITLGLLGVFMPIAFRSSGGRALSNLSMATLLATSIAARCSGCSHHFVVRSRVSAAWVGDRPQQTRFLGCYSLRPQ